MLGCRRVFGFVCLCGYVFFFKQKTAYEMRISDWSSDVCSSDLPARTPGPDRPSLRRRRNGPHGLPGISRLRPPSPTAKGSADQRIRRRLRRLQRRHGSRRQSLRARYGAASRLAEWRSEEHTSELQSLMSISYAAIFLKKKKSKKT